MNFREKIFAKFCNKNRTWGDPAKETLSVTELMPLQKEEWKYFWSKYGKAYPDFNGKVIVDYGCGYGFDSLLMLQEGAKHIYCLEISKERLEKSERLHKEYGYSNVTYIDNQDVTQLSKKIGIETVDIIICRDVMEHVPTPYEVLNSMYMVLKKGGASFVGFSLLYKSPYGSHFSSYCKVPWIHLIFSENTILNVFRELYDLPESIKNYQDIPGSGLNKLSYFTYMKYLKKFQWRIEINLKNVFPKRLYLTKISKVIIPLLLFKSVKELFILNTYVKAVKN